MDSVENAVKKSLRALVLTKPYGKITVHDICTEANVSKTAFYKKFDNKDAVIADILCDDICEPVRTIRKAIPTRNFSDEAPGIIDFVQTSNVLEHAAFYKKIITECPMVFLRELTADLAKVNKEVLDTYQMDEVERDYMAFHFAANHTLLIAKWIHDGMEVDQRRLADWYRKWATVNWEAIAWGAAPMEDSPTTPSYQHRPR